MLTSFILRYLKQIQEQKFHIEFLEAYLYYYNRILLAVAINDQQLVSYNIRSVLEQLMKFIYSTQYYLPIHQIKDISFRHLKEDLGKSNIKQETLNKLASYYGTYSKVIHDKDTVTVNIEYIEDGITKEHESLLGLPDILKNILDVFYEAIEEVIVINKEFLTTGDKVMLKHSLNNKRLEKIRKHLFYI